MIYVIYFLDDDKFKFFWKGARIPNLWAVNNSTRIMCAALVEKEQTKTNIWQVATLTDKGANISIFLLRK